MTKLALFFRLRRAASQGCAASPLPRYAVQILPFSARLCLIPLPVCPQDSSSKSKIVCLRTRGRSRQCYSKELAQASLTTYVGVDSIHRHNLSFRPIQPSISSKMNRYPAPPSRHLGGVIASPTRIISLVKPPLPRRQRVSSCRPLSCALVTAQFGERFRLPRIYNASCDIARQNSCNEKVVLVIIKALANQ